MTPKVNPTDRPREAARRANLARGKDSDTTPRVKFYEVDLQTCIDLTVAIINHEQCFLRGAASLRGRRTQGKLNVWTTVYLRCSILSFPVRNSMLNSGLSRRAFYESHRHGIIVPPGSPLQSGWPGDSLFPISNRQLLQTWQRPSLGSKSLEVDCCEPVTYGRACRNCLKSKCKCIARADGKACERLVLSPSYGNLCILCISNLSFPDAIVLTKTVYDRSRFGNGLHV